VAFFPQINGNLIITQLPYDTGGSFETLIVDSPGGARFTYPRRAVNLDDHPTRALARFVLNYSNITDSEVSALRAFFVSMRGRYGSFSFLDPGGNLVQYSETFSHVSWGKSTGPVTAGAAVQDPFGGNRATSMASGGGDSRLLTVIGPASGGISGYRVCVSIWVNARDAGTSLQIGITDATFSQTSATVHPLPLERWVRISHSATLWNTGSFRMLVGGNSTWTSGRLVYMFGAQASPTKGENGYTASPVNYGYYANCRFDTDTFSVDRTGPNSNSLSLPVVEFNA
jgi:hypothetical protein